MKTDDFPGCSKQQQQHLSAPFLFRLGWVRQSASFFAPTKRNLFSDLRCARTLTPPSSLGGPTIGGRTQKDTPKTSAEIREAEWEKSEASERTIFGGERTPSPRLTLPPQLSNHHVIATLLFLFYCHHLEPLSTPTKNLFSTIFFLFSGRTAARGDGLKG